MNTIRHLVQRLTAHAIRAFAVVVLVLVLCFPAYKNLLIVYGPMLVVLWVGALLHRRLRNGWNPMLGWPRIQFLLLAFIGPAVLQAGLLLWLRPEPMFDGRFVYEEALLLTQTGRMPPLTYYPPAQTWWYAGWFAVWGAHPLVAQFSHVPLHAVVTALTYGLAARVAPGRARLVAVAVAWYPSFVGYVLTTPYYHYLYTAMVVATTWAWLAALDRPRVALGAGLASGLGALTKATQLIAPAQALLFWLVCPSPSHPASRIPHLASRILLFLLGMALVITPWTIRNWRVFDDFVPVCTSGGLVLWSANNPESNGLYSGLPDKAAIETPADMLAHSRNASAAAKQFILENPARFIQLAGIKLMHTWGGEATFAELINRRGQPMGRPEDLFSLLFYAGWVLVAALWAAASIAAWRARLALSPLECAVALIVLSNAAVYMVFEGGDRHHLPFVPLVILLACMPGVRRSSQGAG
ncbi:MAG TPA: glycosyltransferase family 39 protein [Kiritimatiellia bacterium]|nr:glycosyltransferase family 39 protein [Kiritimatiellia bacterium]